LLLDLDGFKAVNDTLGHDVGDQLLKQISIRFTRAIPHGVLLARLGGDEFGVIIYGSEAAGLEVAQALRASLSYPFTLAGQSVNVGVSIGRVLSDGRGELLKRADSAMYEAKRSGDGIVRAES
jgi:diguanylate cyclase (GGDEF)-like protein